MSQQSTTIKIRRRQGTEYVKSVAGAIGWQLREFGFCKIRAAGAVAVHVGVKAVAINNRRLQAAGVTLGFDACHVPLEGAANRKKVIPVTEL